MADQVLKTDYLSFSVVCVCKFAHNWIITDIQESMRDLGKSIDYLLIFVSEWMSGDWCAHVTLGLCVCVHACVCVTWSLFDRR